MLQHITQPFAPVQSQEQAMAMGRGSAIGFSIWSSVLLVQAGWIFRGATPAEGQSIEGVMAFLLVQAALAGLCAAGQWFKPNRLLALFGLTWSLYELSSLLVGMMLGMPMAVGALPAWIGAVSAGGLMVCALLQLGGLRGCVAMARLREG